MATNIAGDGTETCDSYYGAAYKCENINDGNTSNRWLSGAGLPHWAQIEWVSSKLISEVAFYAGRASYGEHFSEYYIEYWDGDQWVEEIHVSSYTDEHPTKTSHVVNFTTTKVQMRMVAGATYSALYELEIYGEEPPVVVFTFSDPIPVHQSTVYGFSETLQLTVTVSGEDPDYVYDAVFYNALNDSQIGTTISGTESGQYVTTVMPTPSGIDYSWYLTAVSSGIEDTSSTYTFTNRFLCEGTVTVGGTLTGGIPIKLHRRSTGELVGSTSSTSSGIFEIESTFNEAHYAVALYFDAGTNALIYDWISP